MKRIFLVGALALTALVGGKQARPFAADDTPTWTVSEVMTDLQSPWDAAFLPDGTFFFTEKCKGLSVRLPDATTHFLFGVWGASLEASDFFCLGQSGMTGVAVDPDFEHNRSIYVFMTSSLEAHPRTNRVVRLVVDPTLTKVSERTDIITDIAFKDQPNTWGEAGSHSGGRLRFGPDGYLYITTGDNHNGSLPQDLRMMGGKVLRVDRTGAAAAENSPPTGADPRIFVYGLRNPQGLTFKPSSGRPFIAEHGPNHSDEVTALSNGGNGGWDPRPDPGVVCADNYCGYTSNRLDGKLTSMTDFEKFPEALPPTWTLVDSQGLGPATFITGAPWKGWDGALLVGVMAQKKIHVLFIDDADQVTNTAALSLQPARFRALVPTPDAGLLVLTDEGRILKVTPQ